jgi:hypothetical protein
MPLFGGDPVVTRTTARKLHRRELLPRLVYAFRLILHVRIRSRENITHTLARRILEA